jgi:hypothetical protein
MSGRVREFYREKLRDLLCHTDPDELCQAYCAAFSLYEGETALASRQFRNFPQEATSATLGSPVRFHDWEAETVVNEAFALPKRGGGFLILPNKLDLSRYSSLLHLSQILRRLENEEYGDLQHDVLRELARIIQREFEWQRGWFNKALIYRTAKIYGHPKVAPHIFKRTGFSVEQLTYLEFVLTIGFKTSTILDIDTSFDQIGIDQELIEIGLPIFAGSMDSAFEEARRTRSGQIETAYRPSFLRRKPILYRKAKPRQIICPIPSLIMDRGTRGLYFDLVDGSGVTRSALGEAFEDYAYELLERSNKFEVEREILYKIKKEKHLSPDFFLKQKNRVSVIVETKATRLTYEAAFAVEGDKARGINDMAKGIFQIWKHVSRVRRGLVLQTLDEDVVGAILTLDSWLMGAPRGISKSIREARRMSHETNEEISSKDQISIAFIQVDDLESAIYGSDGSELIEKIREAATTKQGFIASLSLHTGNVSGGFFPDHDLRASLEWWRRIDDQKQEHDRR